MSQFIIRIVGAAGYAPAAPDEGPWYVTEYDPDFNDGLGSVSTSPDPKNALTFATNGEAGEFWRQQSKAKPLRDDGRPNRPLTAFNVMIEPLGEGEADDSGPS